VKVAALSVSRPPYFAGQLSVLVSERRVLPSTQNIEPEHRDTYASEMLQCPSSMLAVSKLSPGQESYYERSVAAGIDDYPGSSLRPISTVRRGRRIRICVRM
jgi:hypothetical protein